MKNRRTRTSPRETEGLYRHIFDAVTEGLILADLVDGRVIVANPAACAMHGYTREHFVGLLPASFIDSESQAAFANYLRSVQSGAQSHTQVEHVRRSGSSFHAEWCGTAFAYQGRLCLLGAVRDVSRRIQADQRLRQRVETRTREQSALLEISHTLASSLELQPGAILEQLRGVVEYTHAGLFGLSDSTFTALAVRGPDPMEPSPPFQIRLERPETLAVLFNGHRPIRIADLGSADPAAGMFRSLLTGDASQLLEGVRAWMWVPLAVQGRMMGGVAFSHAKRDYFTPHHAALALSFADQVAITMANAELYEHARSLAALQERQRLAQDLHDAVNQSLFSAALIAEVLPRLWNRDPAEAQQSVEDLRRLTRGALAEMRALLAELRPTVLTDSSLSDLLRQLADAFTGRTNIPASLTASDEYALPAATQVAFYRICQEALNNVAKHAAASRVWISLEYASRTPQPSAFQAGAGDLHGTAVHSVEMRIRDDGAGFDPARHLASGHYGLDMMGERAEAAGARLTVTSSPGHGTEISVRWQDVPNEEVP
ncbi:MAG TPA: histidine kinase [Anaerolineales bacterium]|nr:histidine kinase [Anaerolineales bacterium]